MTGHWIPASAAAARLVKDWLRRNHFWRPLLVVAILLVVLFVVRAIYVPSDFGTHGSFTYNFYRQASVGEWQSVSIKYQGREYCASCHQKNYDAIMSGPHSVIQCENCHGPGAGHPEKIEKLTPGNSRQLCWRCHTYLPYNGSGRSVVPGIEPNAPHAPLGMECFSCHNPHQPIPLPESQDGEG